MNRVDYARWSAHLDDRRALDSLIEGLSRKAPSRMGWAEAFTYWADLYNAITIKVVLDRYPVRSIRDIKSEGAELDPKAWFGPWRTPRVTVESQRLSLDDIENSVMRRQFRDPRVHYALNCASIGCPSLGTRAWNPSTLDRTLDTAARAYVNHPRGATILSDGRLCVSSIYKWFIEDFGGDDAGIIVHLRKFARSELAEKLHSIQWVAEHTYDWALNSLPS